jgi:hypothetical protein
LFSLPFFFSFLTCLGNLVKTLYLGYGAVAKACFSSLGYPAYATSRDVDLNFACLDSDQGQLQPVGIYFNISDRHSAGQIEEAARGAQVLISFPPHEESEVFLEPLLKHAARLVYLSSTSVYGRHSGEITNSTLPDSELETLKPRLNSERRFAQLGAVILRLPGFYGGERGLHRRIAQGLATIPGDGNNFVSRIHLEDLANIVRQAFGAAQPGEVLVVGDQLPCSYLEIMTYLCDLMQQPLPAFVPLSQVHPTLRGNRQVDSRETLEKLGVTLKYPTYREGYRQCLQLQG